MGRFRGPSALAHAAAGVCFTAEAAIRGGGAWAVGLIWERRTIDIQGIGAWPPHHTTVPGPEWTGFMRAVHRLAGRRGFDPHMLREDV